MSVTTTPPTNPALWRDGDAPGDRRFAQIGDLSLESGEHLPGVVLAYETWGELNASRDNAILVEHALTGDSHVVGERGPGQPTPGWWPGLRGVSGALCSLVGRIPPSPLPSPRVRLALPDSSEASPLAANPNGSAAAMRGVPPSTVPSAVRRFFARRPRSRPLP